MRRKDVTMSGRRLHCRFDQPSRQAELMWSGGQSEVDDEALCPDCRRMEDGRYR